MRSVFASGAPASASRCRPWSSTTIAQEFVRGAQVRREATGTDIVTALIGLVGRSKRRYGGYIVHVGIVLMFLGFAGEGFKQEEQALLKAGRAGDRRPLHRSPRRAPRHERQSEADGDRPREHLRGRKSARNDRRRPSGTSTSASRSRRPRSRFAAGRPRTFTSSSPVSTRRRRRHLYGDRQSAGQLDLVWLRA